MEHMLKNPGIMPGSLEEIQDSRDNMRFVAFCFCCFYCDYYCYEKNNLRTENLSLPEKFFMDVGMLSQNLSQLLQPPKRKRKVPQRQREKGKRGTGASKTQIAQLPLPPGIIKETEPWQTHAIISNPPAFAHYHVAERLGVPLHIFFTMPWSPTKEFPHPLANMSFEKRTARRNLFSYYLVDTLTWTGLGDMVNNLRTKSLGLPAVTTTVGQTLMHYSHVSFFFFFISKKKNRLPSFSLLTLTSPQVPHAYIWSPNLIPKPKDWGPHIDIAGFFYLSLGCNYTPPPELDAFLKAGDPPIYVGFGSIVMEDSEAMTKIIFEV